MIANCTFRIQAPDQDGRLQPGGDGGRTEGSIEATPAATPPTELHSGAPGPGVEDSQRPKFKPGADIDMKYLPQQLSVFQSYKVEESSMGF